MNLKSNLKKIPFVDNTYRNIRNWPKYFSNKKILEQIAVVPYSQVVKLKEVVNQFKTGLRNLPESEKNFLKKIENERKHLLSEVEPLIDGSLGKGGLYDQGMTIRRTCEASKPSKPALMLYLLTKTIEPQNVIELGTNVGISSAYIAAALKLSKRNGNLVTLDASPYRQRIAKEIHNNLGINDIKYVEGLFMDTLDESLKKMVTVDLAFIDGHHQYQPTLDYYEKILQYSTQSTVFVFDDIRWTEGMEKAWSEIRNDDRLGVVLDLYSVGICMLHQKDISQKYVFDPIYLF